jgi:hypothetical protein
MIAVTKQMNDTERFIALNVQAAEEGRSVAWIAKQLNQSEDYVAQKRVRFRNAGIPLPLLRKGTATEPLDVDHYTSLIEKLMGGGKGKRERSRVHAAMGA